MSQSNNRRVTLKVLQDADIEAIHFAVLKLLSRTGCIVNEPESLKLLKDAGCLVTNNNRVRIPAWLVEEAVRLAPKTITLYDRLGNPRLYLEGSNHYYGCGSDMRNTIDLETGQRRPNLFKDVKELIKLQDCLPNIDLVYSMGIMSDYPSKIANVLAFKTMIENTTKPMKPEPLTREHLEKMWEMAVVVAGDEETLKQKPFFLSTSSAVCPLRHERDALEKLLFAVEKGLPWQYSATSFGGATGPATGAGSIAQQLADCLVGLVISQLKKKGSPIIIGPSVTSMDMRTMIGTAGSPERNLWMVAVGDVESFYGIPSYGAVSTDSLFNDRQAAVEGTLSLLLRTLSSAPNLIFDVGTLETYSTASFEHLLISDEIISMVKNIAQGLTVDTETLALDAIDRVGPGGHFLTDEHTLKHHREFYRPRLMTRKSYENWVEEGKKSLSERLRNQVRESLSAHSPPPVSEKVRVELNRIFDDFKKFHSQGQL